MKVEISLLCQCGKKIKTARYANEFQMLETLNNLLFMKRTHWYILNRFDDINTG